MGMTLTTYPTPPALEEAEAISSRLASTGAATFADGSFPHREMDVLRRAGYYGLTVAGGPLPPERPETDRLLQVLKLIGRGNLSAGRLYEGHVNALELIHRYGTAAQRDRYHGEARAGLLFGVWNTEMADGIHLHERPDGRVEIRGCKTFCSGADHVQRPVITGVRHDVAGNARGWQMVVVPLDRLNVPVDESFWTPLGMRNSVSYKLDFSGVVLDPDELIGQPDDYERQPYFSGGAIRFAAVHLGAAEALLDATRRFLRRLNRQDNAHQKTRVGRMAILVETGNQWLERAGRVYDRETDSDRVVAFANMTRTVVADICTECLQFAIQSVGSRGLMHPGELARLVPDLTMYLRQPAPDLTLELVGQYHLSDDQSHHARWSSRRL